jgi:hypothetical protein
MNSKAVPHNAAKRILEMLYTFRKFIFDMFSADQIKYKLIGIQGTDNQFAGFYLGAIIESYSFSSAIFYDNSIHLSIDVKFTSNLTQHLMSGVGYHMGPTPVKADRGQ